MRAPENAPTREAPEPVATFVILRDVSACIPVKALVRLDPAPVATFVILSVDNLVTPDMNPTKDTAWLWVKTLFKVYVVAGALVP